MSDLKPCPFCGAAPIVEQGQGHETAIVCKTPMCAGEDNYVWDAKAWNRRAQPADATLMPKMEATPGQRDNDYAKAYRHGWNDCASNAAAAEAHKTSLEKAYDSVRARRAATVPGDELEAFEAWAKQHYGYREFSLEPFLPISDHWRGCWAAWKARAALAAPAAPVEPMASRQTLRTLVDYAWQVATDSTELPETNWADDIIDKVMGAAPAAQAAPQGRPSREWYARMIQKTLDDDFVIGAHHAAPQAGEDAQPVTLGWKLAPQEPTADMIEAARQSYDAQNPIYAALVAAFNAAPTAQIAGWLRVEREGKASLDPLFLLGAAMPKGYIATYSPVVVLTTPQSAAQAAQAVPDANSLYLELSGIDEDLKHGGLGAFDQTCWNTLRRVMRALTTQGASHE